MAKFVTAQEAVQYIHSGDRVALAHSVGEPQALSLIHISEPTRH